MSSRTFKKARCSFICSLHWTEHGLWSTEDFRHFSVALSRTLSCKHLKTVLCSWIRCSLKTKCKLIDWLMSSYTLNSSPEGFLGQLFLCVVIWAAVDFYTTGREVLEKYWKKAIFDPKSEFARCLPSFCSVVIQTVFQCCSLMNTLKFSVDLAPNFWWTVQRVNSWNRNYHQHWHFPTNSKSSSAAMGRCFCLVKPGHRDHDQSSVQFLQRTGICRSPEAFSIVAGFHIADYFIFAAVLIASTSIGLYHAFTGGRQRTTNEYFMANHKLRTLPVAASILVSFVSAITVLGTPAEMYTRGTQMFMRTIGYCISLVISSLVFVPLFFPLKITSSFEVRLLIIQRKLFVCGWIVIIRFKFPTHVWIYQQVSKVCGNKQITFARRQQTENWLHLLWLTHSPQSRAHRPKQKGEFLSWLCLFVRCRLVQIRPKRNRCQLNIRMILFDPFQLKQLSELLWKLLRNLSVFWCHFSIWNWDTNRKLSSWWEQWWWSLERWETGVDKHSSIEWSNKKQCTGQLQVRSPRGVCFVGHFLFFFYCIWLLGSFASGY